MVCLYNLSNTCWDGPLTLLLGNLFKRLFCWVFSAITSFDPGPSLDGHSPSRGSKDCQDINNKSVIN